MENITGIIISVQKYRDSDLILQILTESGSLISVSNRGGEKLNSKTHEFCYSFLKADFEIYKANTKHYKLKTGKIKRNLYKVLENNFDDINIYSFLEELNKKFPPISDFEKYYKLYDLTIENLSTKDKKYFYVLLFLIVIIKLSGYQPSFENTSYEKDKKIALDINKGEFIEYEEELDNLLDVDIDNVKLIETLFMNKYRYNEGININENLSVKLIKLLVLYLSIKAEIKIVGLI